MELFGCCWPMRWLKLMSDGQAVGCEPLESASIYVNETKKSEDCDAL